jgi:hypothetical protein
MGEAANNQKRPQLDSAWTQAQPIGSEMIDSTSSHVVQVFQTQDGGPSLFRTAIDTPSESESPPPDDARDDVEDAFNELQNSGVLPPPSLREPVMVLVNRKRVDAIFNRDYLTADSLSHLGSFLMYGDHEAIRRQCQADHDAEQERRINELKTRYDEHKTAWADRITETENECEFKSEQLDSQHQQEIADFKAKWQCVDYVKRFYRASPHLLQFRYVERQLAVQRHFIEANSVKTIGDGVQRQEEAVAQAELELRMRGEYSRMRARHKEEFDKLDTFYGTAITNLQVKMGRDLNEIEKALAALGIRRSTPLTMRHLIHTHKGLPQAMSAPTSTMTTPRTTEKYGRFKTRPPAALNIAPMDDAKFAKLSTAPVRQKRRPLSAAESQFPKLV